MSHMHRNKDVCRFISPGHCNALAALSHILLQSPWQSVGSRDNWNAPVRRLTIKAYFTDLSCTQRGGGTTHQVNYGCWLTISSPNSAGKAMAVLIGRELPACSGWEKVHKTSHAACPGEVCHGLNQPFFPKSLKITHWVSYSPWGAGDISGWTGIVTATVVFSQKMTVRKASSRR